MNKTLSFLVVLFCIPLVLAYSNQTGLISEWRLDGNAVDSYGANNGTLNGTLTVVTGNLNSSTFNDKALKFTGTYENFINVSNTASFDIDDITICTFLNSTNLGQQQEMASKFLSTGNLRTFRFEILDNRNIAFYPSYDGVSTATGLSNSNLSLLSNKVYFICGTWDGGVNSGYPQVFLNGVNVSNRTASVANSGSLFYSANTPFRIGSYQTTPTRVVNGTLNEVTLWSRALPESEIKQMYDDYLIGIRPSDVQSESNPCVYSGSGDWYINNTVCNITGLNGFTSANKLYVSSAVIKTNVSIPNLYLLNNYTYIETSVVT